MKLLPQAVIAAVAALCACSTDTGSPAHASSSARRTFGASTSAGADVVFTGMCDASGAVPLSRTLFAVADDEDNVLRIYDAERGGAAVAQSDVSSEIGIEPRPSKDPSRPPKPPAEADIEAATIQDGLAFWLTSHGRNRSGKQRPERLRFFATNVSSAPPGMTQVGNTYLNLIDALATVPELQRFDLPGAAKLAPKNEGGLALEGMTARLEGGVFIGFRNPIPDGKALVVVLANPKDVVMGGTPEFGVPHLLDLAGLGIRGMSHWRGRYLILAGAPDDSAASKLFSWDGVSDAVQALDVNLRDLNPEGFFTPEDRDDIMVLSDDGATLLDGTPCKRLDAVRKRFRGRWLRLSYSTTRT